MSDKVFTGPGMIPVDPDLFKVVLSGGLAMIANESVTKLTGGAMQPPAAVFVVETVSGTGRERLQLLFSQGSMAALCGSLRAWSRRLPVDARDQFDALAAEAEQKFTAVLDETGGAW